MRRGSSWIFSLVLVTMCLFPLCAAASMGSVANSSQWNVKSYKVDLLDHRGGSGDIQVDPNNWIHLGANHLEGGDIKYDVKTGILNRTDILEVWIDGYSTSNDLNIGPTVFVGTGKNRFEQITRMDGDAWRPFVFRFADDALYGDVTDPSNRNANWRIRYPSSKYEVRRIDKSPQDLLAGAILPIRISITGAEDFIIKRIEVVVYRTQRDSYDGLYIVNVEPYKVKKGDMMTLQLSRSLPLKNVAFYITDADGREHSVSPLILNETRNKVGFYAEDSPFIKGGRYQVKVVDRTLEEREFTDIEQFEFVVPKPKTVTKRPTPPKSLVPPPCNSAIEGACAPVVNLPPVPTSPSAYSMPMRSGAPIIQPVVPMAPMGGQPVMVPPSSSAGVHSTDDPTAYLEGYTIQVGAYNTQASAVARRQKLQSYGYAAYVSETVQKGKRIYRVRVGKYPDKAMAQQDAHRLRNSGFETWVTSTN